MKKSGAVLDQLPTTMVGPSRSYMQHRKRDKEPKKVVGKLDLV